MIERIASQAGAPHLFPALAGLPASDLQSLLLHVYQSRTAEFDLAELLRKADRALLQASGIDARLLNLFDRLAFEAAQGFEAIDLSPVCGFGLNHALGAIGQNNVLTTIRNAEVLGDATMPLAVECSRRRRDAGGRRSRPPVRFANSHRVVRLQPFDVPGYVPHFRLFSMVTAGRDTGSQTFETHHLGEHIRCYLRLFRELNAHGFQISSPLVEISDTAIARKLLANHGVSPAEIRESIRAHRPGGSERFLAERGIVLPAETEGQGMERLRSNLLDPLQAEFPEAQFRFDLGRLEGLHYYTGYCLRISPLAPDGQRYPVADGGFTDWTARLLQDKKERLLTSGIGTEFVCLRYRAQ